MKQYIFFGGLPRSGSHLLSVLLNQHPDIYVSPLSPLLPSILDLQKAQASYEETQINDFSNRIEESLKQYANSFYNDISRPIIIDRCKIWGCKESVEVATKYFGARPKIILTVRDIPSILSSFVSILRSSPMNDIERNIQATGIRLFGEESDDDYRCDWFMAYQIRSSLISIHEALQGAADVHLVEYDNLVSDPQSTLNGIYDFIGVVSFMNTLTNLKGSTEENLDKANLPSGLHIVRPEIENISPLPNEVLSELTLRKYSNLEFWRDVK